MSNENPTTSQPQVGTTALFSPFEHWGSDMYGLCAQDGKITKEPSYEKQHTEWRIVKYGEGLWEVEVADEPEGYEVVYRGKIPSNRFLLELLSNLETAPPLDGENDKDQVTANTKP